MMEEAGPPEKWANSNHTAWCRVPGNIIYRGIMGTVWYSETSENFCQITRRQVFWESVYTLSPFLPKVFGLSEIFLWDLILSQHWIIGTQFTKLRGPLVW